MTEPICHVEQSETSGWERQKHPVTPREGNARPWESRRPLCHSEECALHTTWESRRRECIFVTRKCIYQQKTEILTSRPKAAPQNDRTQKNCHSEEPQATWESQRATCRSLHSFGITVSLGQVLLRIAISQPTRYVGTRRSEADSN